MWNEIEDGMGVKGLLPDKDEIDRSVSEGQNELLVMPKIAEIYKRNAIPFVSDETQLKYELDFDNSKSDLVDFIIEITKVLKNESNFSA